MNQQVEDLKKALKEHEENQKQFEKNWLDQYLNEKVKEDV